MPQVNIDQALDLRLNHGLSYEHIGKIQGTSKTGIYRALAKLMPSQETEIFKQNRADILANIQLKALSAVTEPKLKKASAKDLVISAGILYDKERLERGLSTENVSYRGLTEDYGKLTLELRKLESEFERLNEQGKET